MLVDKHGNRIDMPLDFLKGALITNENGAEFFIRHFTLDEGNMLIMWIDDGDIDSLSSINNYASDGIPISGEATYRWTVMQLKAWRVPSK